ncbi:MAG TPA: Gfo/Idh/MocA family oxidoreductase [Thermoprotei archaeon]|nr:Gfo/Idh/MocA family oxidoreductase [Thermoprotei archaeon]
MSKIRVGIIGCGGVSWRHVLRLRRNPRVELAAFCDIDLERARMLRNEVYGAEYSANEILYSDYKEMIDKAELDAVCVFTPHALHYSQITYALDRGLHVLSEKPLCCTVEEAEDIVRRAEERNLVVLVSFQRRFIESYIKAKELVQEKLSKLKLITVYLNQDWRKLAKGTWRASKKLGYRGMLFDSGSHVVDLVLWISKKKPLKVYAKIDCDDFEVDLNSVVLAELEDGVLVSFSICGDAPRGMTETETFYGRNGTAVRIDNGRVSLIYEHGDRLVFNTPPIIPEGKGPDDNFINAILGLEENRSPAKDFLRVISLMEAVYKSSRENRPVDVEEIYS